MEQTTTFQATANGYRLPKATDTMLGLRLPDTIAKPIERNSNEEEEDAILALYQADNGLYIPD